jgi:hypothetical protein
MVHFGMGEPRDRWSVVQNTVGVAKVKQGVHA